MNTILPYINETRKLDNKQYRKWFKENHISKFYRPWLHVLLNGGTLLSCIVFNILNIREWSLSVLSVFIFSMLLGNFVVWAVHRYPLHRRFKFWTYPYDTHTVMHHRYFTADYITYDDFSDVYAVFFPIHVVVGFGLVIQPLFYFSVNYFFGSQLAYAFCASTAFYFLLYEFVHWASHLAENHPLMKVGWLRYMRNHHIVHHNPKLMMKYNFCIVYPLMDILMGTSYKEKVLPKDDAEDHFNDVKNNLSN